MICSTGKTDEKFSIMYKCILIPLITLCQLLSKIRLEKTWGRQMHSTRYKTSCNNQILLADNGVCENTMPVFYSQRAALCLWCEESGI